MLVFYLIFLVLIDLILSQLYLQNDVKNDTAITNNMKHFEIYQKLN